MTNYNLNCAKEKDYKENTTDLDYLLAGYKSLDELNIEALEKFLRENPDNPYAKRLKKGLDQKYLDVVKSDRKRKWRGKRLYDLYVKNHLKSVDYKPFYAKIDNGVFYPELKEVQVLDYDLGYKHKPEEFKIYAQTLKKYQNVKELKLLGRNDLLKSLYFLDSLPNLKTLDAKHFYFEAMEFQLAGGAQLEEIAMNYVYKRNLNIASFYPDLKVLHIKSDYVQNITGWGNVAGVKNLRLRLNENAKVDITPLAQLESLSLDGLKECEIKDNLTTLKCLYLRRMAVIFKEITEYPNLETLYCTESEVVDLRGIEQMPKLKNLNVALNNIESIEEIKNLQNLENLNISNNRVKDISVLENLKSLKRLNIENTSVSNTAVLYELPNLERLYASKSVLRKLDLNRLPKGIKIPNYSNLETEANNEIRDLRQKQEEVIVESVE